MKDIRDGLPPKAAGDSELFKPWLDEFHSSDNEGSFRLWSLADDKLLVNVLIRIGLVAMAMFLLNDLRMRGQMESFEATISIRTVALGIYLIAGVFYNRLNTIKSFDMINSWLIIVLIILVVGTDALRPSDFFTHIGVDVTIIYICYMANPVSLRLRLLCATVCSTGLLLVLFLVKEPAYDTTYASYTTSILLSNFLGYWIAMRHGRSRRSAYIALQSERLAREKIKALEGILPICSYCKHIRDDEGSWEQLESYIDKRSEASFSHGICPSCKDIHFPNLT